MSEREPSAVESKNIPEQIYQNVSLHNGIGLLLTMTDKDRDLQIPQDPEKSPSEEGVSIVLENKGRYSIRPELSSRDVLQVGKMVLPRGIYESLLEKNSDTTPESLTTFISDLLLKLDDGDPERLRQFNYYLSIDEKMCGALVKEKDEYTPLPIKGFLLRGKRINLGDDLDWGLHEEILESLHHFEKVALPEGSQIYTKLSASEFQELMKNGRMVVRQRTDFFDSEETANALSGLKGDKYPMVRIKTNHPFFSKKGGYGRVTTLMAHVSEVEILHEGRWVSPLDMQMIEMEKQF